MSGMEPLLIAAAVASAAGSVGQGVMGYQQGMQRAKLLTQDSVAAREAGASEAQEIGEDRIRAIGSAVARQGASGFAMDESALAVIGDIASQHAHEAAKARYSAARQSRRLRAEATQAKTAATMSLLKGITDAAGSGLSAAAAGPRASSAQSGGNSAASKGPQASTKGAG